MPTLTDFIERKLRQLEEEYGVSDVIWRTREGIKLRVGDMSDDHLLNAHRLHCEKVWYFAIEGVSQEPSVDKMGSHHLPRCVAAARMLRVEIDGRGLRPKTPRVPVLPGQFTPEGRVGR